MQLNMGHISCSNARYSIFGRNERTRSIAGEGEEVVCRPEVSHKYQGEA